MKKYYDLDYAKKELNKFMKQGSEPEICIKIEGNEYMIIPLKNKISFQWIGNTKEFYFDSVEELFKTELINSIVLNRDWNKIEKIWYV